MKRIKNTLACCLLFASVIFSKKIIAQVGIGTTTPNASAMLEINSNTKGLLIPRMTASQISSISFPAKGLLVYQTDGVEGFYYNAGIPPAPVWTTVSSASGSAGWNLTGNTGTNTIDNFIGTTDSVAMDIHTNNLVKVRIAPRGQIEIYNTGNSVFLGRGAGALDDLNNRYNVLIGDSAGALDIFGYNNTALGRYALFAGGGSLNTAIGAEALHNNSGYRNTAVGYQAASNNNGSDNLALGDMALNSSMSGDGNTAIGAGTMSINNGEGNTAVGSAALVNNSMGIDNTVIGAQAGNNSTTGSYNTTLGYFSAFDEGINNSTAIGSHATVKANNTIVLGNNAIISLKCNTQTISSLSDIRFKTNIQNNVHGLDFIMKLEPITYHLNIHKLNEFIYGNKGKRIFKGEFWEKSFQTKETILYSGFSAQQVEQAANKIGYNFCGIVKPVNDKDTYSLSYSDFVVPLVKAVQELSTENDLLKEKLLKQEKDIDVLKKEMEQINKRLKAESMQ